MTNVRFLIWCLGNTYLFIFNLLNTPIITVHSKPVRPSRANSSYNTIQDYSINSVLLRYCSCVLHDLKTWNHCICLLRHSFSFAAIPTLSIHGFYTHPCTLASNKLVIFSLNACSAANVIIFLLKVWIILQLFRGLERETGKESKRRDDKLIKDTNPVYSKLLFHWLPAQKILFPFCFKLTCVPSQSRIEIELS